MMNNKKISKSKILNIDLDLVSKKCLMKDLDQGVVFTPNVDHLVKLQKDPSFYDAYMQADFIVCDSRIVKLVSSFLGNPIEEAIPGSDLLPAFCDYHKDNDDIKIFLLGADVGVASKAMDNINKRAGRGIVVGAHSPSYGFEKCDEECKAIVDLINSTEANVLVVGVGAPKQENWIIKYKSLLHNVKIFLALGATIDFEAGNIARAPIVFRNLGVEWLFRLFCEPKRLWRRYLIEDMPFFYLVLKQKLGFYENPFFVNQSTSYSTKQKNSELVEV